MYVKYFHTVVQPSLLPISRPFSSPQTETLYLLNGNSPPPPYRHTQYMHLCAYTYICVHVYTRTHMYVHTCIHMHTCICVYTYAHTHIFLKILFIYFQIVWKGGRTRRREGEKHHVWLPLMCPQLGMWPATQACALTGNQTHDPSVYGTMLQLTRPHQPGLISNLLLNM